MKAVVEGVSKTYTDRAGHSVDALPPGRPPTAMVFQEFALFPWRTVMAWWVKHGFMRQVIPLQDIVDTSFLEAAVKALPE